MASESTAKSIEIAQILEQIRQRWSVVVAPEADRRKWDADLAVAFAEHGVWNLTDFNYGKCHTYVVFAHPGIAEPPRSADEERKLIERLGGKEYNLLVKLSVVAPYAVIKLLCREVVAGQITERETGPTTVEQAELVRRMEDFVRRHGMEPIPPEHLNELVPGAELELALPGTVTIYNCLFEDEENIPR